MGRSRRVSVAPSAARLTESLRDIGYDFASAVADLVDNSVAAWATRVEILIEFDGLDSRVVIADDGSGMSESGLVEALRFGSRRGYGGNLGRYGLGLKTASLSQCRSLTVVTRLASPDGRIAARTLDLDLNIDYDDWLVVDPGRHPAVTWAEEWLSETPGTVVVWRVLDRVLPEERPDGGWARRRFDTLARKTGEHLSMVFHRFLEGLPSGRRVTMLVNGEKLRPWNPFAPDEPATRELAAQRFEVMHGDAAGTVRLQRFVLPPRDKFSSTAEFDRLSGPGKWNRQQGLYVYRADRLVQWGGWAGLRAIDEHTKLARASLDFDIDLDAAFNINVAKMRVSPPAQLRQMLERPVHELCMKADSIYRKAARRPGNPVPRAKPKTSFETAGLALRSAAIRAGEYQSFKRLAKMLREESPEVADMLGL